jgi:hypothetical protein
MYGLIHIYDRINENNNYSYPHEIVVIARVFFTCVKLVTFKNDIPYSIGIPKIKYCISTTYNLLYKSEITYNFEIIDLSFPSCLEFSNIFSFYSRLSEENRKYFNHSLTHNEYISNMNSLFQEISKELENDDQIYLDSLQSFCQSYPIYQRYNEFLNIYWKILDHFKEEKEMIRINDKELLSIFEYIIKTIGTSNLPLFLSIDVKKLVQIYFNLVYDFKYIIGDVFVKKHYLNYAQNLKSIYFLTEFITSMIDCIKKQIVSEEDQIEVFFK